MLFLFVFASGATVVVGLVLFEVRKEFVILLKEFIVDIDFCAFFAFIDYVFEVFGLSFVGFESFEEEPI